MAALSEAARALRKQASEKVPRGLGRVVAVCSRPPGPQDVWSLPNVRAKRATTAGRQARAGENVPRTARPGLVACRWRSA